MGKPGNDPFRKNRCNWKNIFRFIRHSVWWRYENQILPVDSKSYLCLSNGSCWRNDLISVCKAGVQTRWKLFVEHSDSETGQCGCSSVAPRVPSLGLFWHAVEFCAKGSPGFTGLTMWKGALFNVTYARDKPIQIFFYHGLQRQGVPVLRLQCISSLCLLSFRANWLKACQFLKTICGRMKWEKLKWVIQKHFLNCSTGIEPKNQSNMSSSPRFLHIILRSLRLQAAHSHLSLPASLDCFCSAERKTVKRFHFTHSTTTLKVNKKEVGGSPSVFRYWHTLVVTSDLK